LLCIRRLQPHFLNCAADADRFVRAIGVPGCGSLYDTFHANIEAFGMATPALSVARKIWLRMYQDEETIAREGFAFLKRMATSHFPAPVPASIPVSASV
jgi:hypothetical protein